MYYIWSPVFSIGNISTKTAGVLGPSDALNLWRLELFPVRRKFGFALRFGVWVRCARCALRATGMCPILRELIAGSATGYEGSVPTAGRKDSWAN